jgi:maltooligosyltrehalose trehalohydrolase
VSHTAREWPLGAVPMPDGGFHFLVWAPNARRVSVVFPDQDRPAVRLEPFENGYFEGTDPLSQSGQRYWLRVDGHRLADPTSRSQPEGPAGPSALVDLSAWRRRVLARHSLDLSRAVLYELHVGTFSPEGTFAGALGRLPQLVDLGVTAVELMPVEEERGERGWGYGPVHQFAVSRSYGGPEGLSQFVVAAHRAGLGVLLDVVYNHWSHQASFLERFGPYFHMTASTPWGPTPNLDGPGGPEVRRYLLESAQLWLEHYGVDGFRLDAVHEIHERAGHPFWAEFSDHCRAVGARSGRRPVLIAESALNDVGILRPTSEGGWGLDAQWSDDFHHALHAALTGERAGYYIDYGPLPMLAQAFERPFLLEGGYSRYLGRAHGKPAEGFGPEHFVVFDQNHDQVGNRGDGARLTTLLPPGLARVALGLTLFAPYVPMLFMGEEYGETRPFYFFADPPPRFARRLTEGRLRQLREHGFADAPPDPGEEATFERSRLDWDAAEAPAGRTFRAFVSELIRLRRELPALGPGGTLVARAGEEPPHLVIRRDRGNASAVLLANLAPVAGRIPDVGWPGEWEERLNSDVPVRVPHRAPFPRSWSLAGRESSLPVSGHSFVVLELTPSP